MRISKKTSLIRTILVIVAFLCAVFVTTTVQSEDYEYKVTGINLRTQERVVGYIIDDFQNGTVSGVIWDRMGLYPVNGTWSGKGQIRLNSRLSSFSVEVVEE